MKKLLYSFLTMLLMTACATESDTNGIVCEGLLTIPNIPDQWTYVSLTKGCVVGSCALTDTASQRQWASRTDWDMATCNGMIRTNGGDSGSGQGAAATTSSDYNEVDVSHPFNYANDRDTVEIW